MKKKSRSTQRGPEGREYRRIKKTRKKEERTNLWKDRWCRGARVLCLEWTPARASTGTNATSSRSPRVARGGRNIAKLLIRLQRCAPVIRVVGRHRGFACFLSASDPAVRFHTPHRHSRARGVRHNSFVISYTYTRETDQLLSRFSISTFSHFLSFPRYTR